jgi:signal transduction histidine kinase/CheY-like chemotaxis protein
MNIPHHTSALITEQSPQPTWLTTLDGSMVYLNAAALKLLHLPSAESLLGSRDWLDRVHSNDRLNAWPDTTQLQLGAPLELTYRITPQGDVVPRWIRDRRQRICDPSDGTHYISGTWDDITAQQLANVQREAQLRRDARHQQRERLQSLRRLASSIGHSMGNYLTPIMSFSELALGSLPHGHPASPDIQQIIASSRQANALIQQLLAFSKKQLLQKHPTDLNQLIQASAPHLRNILDEHIHLELALCDQPAIVRADATRIEQALIHLVTNARSAMSHGGTLTIQTALAQLHDVEPTSALSPGSYVRVIIQDTGSGIDPRIIHHIFEPFFTTQRHIPGAGLGLAITYGIITQHKGSISVESDPAGTTFELLLPVYHEQLHEPSTAEISFSYLNPSPRSGQEIILVVEDDDVVRELINRILRRHGYEIITAESGEQALQLISRHQELDLLLTDVIMPEMSGPELAVKLLTKRPNLRVLYASGHADHAIVQDTQSGAHHFLYKPFTAQSLVSKVREVLSG